MQRVITNRNLALLALLMLLLAGFIAPRRAEAAAAASLAKADKPTASLTATSGAAIRAQSDVQLRRLKTLFADKMDPERFIEKVKTLQQSLNK